MPDINQVYQVCWDTRSLQRPNDKGSGKPIESLLHVETERDSPTDFPRRSALMPIVDGVDMRRRICTNLIKVAECSKQCHLHITTLAVCELRGML